MTLLDPITQQSIPEEEPDVPFMESVSAGMQRQNPLSQYAASVGAAMADEEFQLPSIIPQQFPSEEGYSPFDDPAIRGYDPSHFTGSYSTKQTAHIVQKINRSREIDRKAGITGEVLGAIGNPILTIPALLTGGQSLLVMMAVEGGAEILNEAILHQTLPTRTKTESLINTGLAVSVTGVLGHIGSKIEKKYMMEHKDLWEEEIAMEADRLGKTVEEMTDVDVANIVGTPISGVEGTIIGEGTAAGVRDERHAGAQQAFGSSPEGEKMVGGKVTEALAQGPLARVLSGVSVKAKVLAQRIADTPFILRKHLEGKTFGPSIEARVGKYEGLKYQGYVKAKNLYKDFKNKNPDASMSFRDFDIEVGRALSNNDTHMIPQVQSAAKWYRQNVLNPLLKDAQDLSLLQGTKAYYKKQLAHAKRQKMPESYIDDLAKKLDDAPEKLHVGAATYFPRVFNPEKIIQNYDSLHDAITRKLASGEDVDFIEAQTTATDIMRNLLGGDPLESAARKAIPTASAFKERSLTFSDQFLDPYLDKEATSVLNRHLDTVGREIEFAKEFSNKRLSDEIASVADEYQSLIDVAKGAKAKKALQREKQQTMTDLAAMRDRLHGIYGRPADPSTALVKAGRIARIANATAMLGGVTLSSMADVARPIMMQGLQPFAKGIVSMATNWKQFNLSRNEMKRWGVGLEAAMGDVRLQQIADVNSMGSKGRAVMDVFGKVTGISYWNAGWKQFTGVMAGDQILGAALSKSVPKDLMTRLARAGINEDGLKAIRQQFAKHGNTDQGLRLANTHLWDDDYARDILESAVRSEVNMTIVTPGVGDAPLFMSTEMGKLLTQFKSFLMSATNRMLINGVQRSDRAFFTGLIASVSMGALVGGIKAELRGKDTSEWTADQWLMEGIDRSGVLGIYNIPYNWARTATGQTPSRNIQRSLANQIAGDFVGPSAGQGVRMAGIASDIATGEADDRTAEQATRLLPLQNLLHLRQAVERMQE